VDWVDHVLQQPYEFVPTDQLPLNISAGAMADRVLRVRALSPWALTRYSPAARVLARVFYPYGHVRRVRRGVARGVRSSWTRHRADICVGRARTWGWSPGRARGAGHDRVGRGRQSRTGRAHSRATRGSSGSVVSIEPAAEVFRSLARNLKLNGMGHVRAVEAAAPNARPRRVHVPSGATDSGQTARRRDTYTNPDARHIEVSDANARPAFSKRDRRGDCQDRRRGRRGRRARRRLATARERAAQDLHRVLHGPDDQAAVRALVRAQRGTAGRPRRAVAVPTGPGQHPLVCCPWRLLLSMTISASKPTTVTFRRARSRRRAGRGGRRRAVSPDQNMSRVSHGCLRACWRWPAFSPRLDHCGVAEPDAHLWRKGCRRCGIVRRGPGSRPGGNIVRVGRDSRTLVERWACRRVTSSHRPWSASPGASCQRVSFSPFDRCGVCAIDGFGDFVSTSWAVGRAIIST